MSPCHGRSRPSYLSASRTREGCTMRGSISVAIAVAALSAAAAAGEEWQALRDRLVSMQAVDHVGARAGWALYDCATAAATDLGNKPEPTVHDADWRPAKDRPTLVQEAATAMSSCAAEEAKAAGVLAAPEFEAIKASVLTIAADT